MNAYQVGDLVHLTVSFVNSVGTPTDPTAITCTVKLRYVGTTTTYTYAGGTVTKTGTGEYYVDFTPTTEGIWDYRWTGTGTVQAAVEGAFNVPDSQFF